MSDYVRDRWSIERGFPGGPVYAITQTPDGYLWIGAEKGLVRFDGVNFRLFNQENTSGFPAGPVLGLMTDAEGNLWIRPQSRNMLRYRNGIFQNVMPDLDSAHQGITAMCRGPRGEALFAVLGSGAFIYTGGRFERLLSLNFLAISMANTGDGKLWMGARDVGLFFGSGEAISSVASGLPDRKINSLLPVGDRELWVATDNGVARWNGYEVTRAGVPAGLEHVQVLSMTVDRQFNIWLATGRGLFRMNVDGLSSSPEESDHGSTGTVNAVFEDREGNLWIGGVQGIERLRDSLFMSYFVSTSLSPESSGAIYIDDDGRTWFAPSDGGLYWRRGGQSGSVKQAGLDHDVIYSMTGRKGELWVGRRRGGLTRLKYGGGTFTAETYTEAAGLAQNTIYAVHQSRDGTVWAASMTGGLTRLKDGKFTTYTAPSFLPSNSVTSIIEGSDGTMWFGTANGVSSLSQDHWRVYGSMDGLPPGSVNCLLEDSSGALWIGTDNGIAVLRSGRIHVPVEVLESLHEPVLGVAEDRNEWLWVSTSNHILRVRRDRFADPATGPTDLQEFGLADGLQSVQGIKRPGSVLTDSLGRIWISTSRGLSVVDPRHLTGNSAPAIVLIEGVTADGSAIDLHGDIHIPGTRQRLTFNYAGLSLSVPERVRFRYMLDAFDQGWSDAVPARAAVYTNLAPGLYSFRVIASNSDGLWNSDEAVVRFEIERAFWQTWWFRLCCAAALGLAALGFYRLRMRQLTSQLNLRFEERLGERTRIAQELHDTLLQGFLSASMQLHVAEDQLPPDSPAKPQLIRVLQLMGRVIEEGRNAVRGLRSFDGSGIVDLEQAFSLIPQELAMKDQVGFRVIIEGRPRPLHPVIRDEVYRIGREALVNAFRHSRAKKIEVEVDYAVSHLRIMVRDDGRGIDPQVLHSGREGHWGLPGMRERAEAVGARLKVWSRASTGTEVELSVPSQVAFQNQPPDRRRAWFAGWRRLGLRSTSDEPESEKDR